ncbi:MAG: hypothetical protein ACJ796_20160 [Gemmatimonadaceae bacterium]
MLSSLVILLRNTFGPAAPSLVWPTHARRLDIAGDILSGELTLVRRLADGDEVLCVHGDIVPHDGEVVDGAAIVTDPRDAALASHRRVAVGSPICAGTEILTNFVVVRLGASRSALLKF